MKKIVGTANEIAQLVTELAINASRDELADFLKQAFDDVSTADVEQVTDQLSPDLQVLMPRRIH